MEETTQNRVREFREKKGLSRERLARLADVSTNTVERIEKGGGGRARSIIAISRALGVSVDELFPEPAEAAS